MDLTEIQKKVSDFAKFLVNNAKEDEKEPETEIDNEKSDKRKLIDEVAGMMKTAGCDDEVIRTAIGKMEKIGYDESEDGTADNGGAGSGDFGHAGRPGKVGGSDPKNSQRRRAKTYDKWESGVKNEDEEDEEEYEDLKKDVKKDVANKNKCDNSVNNGIEFYNKLNEIYNSAQANREEATDNYISKADRLKAGEEYFSKAE